jgi:hypothetical protein
MMCAVMSEFAEENGIDALGVVAWQAGGFDELARICPHTRGATVAQSSGLASEGIGTS